MQRHSASVGPHYLHSRARLLLVNRSRSPSATFRPAPESLHLSDNRPSRVLRSTLPRCVDSVVRLPRSGALNRSRNWPQPGQTVSITPSKRAWVCGVATSSSWATATWGLFHGRNRSGTGAGVSPALLRPEARRPPHCLNSYTRRKILRRYRNPAMPNTMPRPTIATTRSL